MLHFANVATRELAMAKSVGNGQAKADVRRYYFFLNRATNNCQFLVKSCFATCNLQLPRRVVFFLGNLKCFPKKVQN